MDTGGTGQAVATPLGAGGTTPARLTSERELEFWRLRTKRAKGAKRLLIHGPLGSGRSTFVDAVVAAEASNYEAVVAARCLTLGELELTIRDQLREQGITPRTDTVATLRDLLGEHKKLLLAIVDPPSTELIERCMPDVIDGLVIVATRDGSWENDADVALGMLEGDETFSVFQDARRHTLHRSAMPSRPLLPRVIRLAAEMGHADDAFPIDDLIDPNVSTTADDQLAMAVRKPVARLEPRARQFLAVLVQLGPGQVPRDLLAVGLGLPTDDPQTAGILAGVTDTLVDAHLATQAPDGPALDWAMWSALSGNDSLKRQRKSLQRLRAAAMEATVDGADTRDLQLAALLRYVDSVGADEGSMPDGELLEQFAAMLADRGALRGAEAMFGTLIDGSARSRSVRTETADTLNDRGLVRFELGDIAPALDDFERALAILESAHDTVPLRKALILANAGRAHARLGQHAPAAAAFERASALLRSTSDDTAFHEAMVSIMLATSAAGLNDLRRARAALRQVRQRLEEISDPRQAAAVRAEMRVVVTRIGDDTDEA